MSYLVLNALDQSPISEATNAAQAIQETVELAQLCETLGYQRFWVAEHHNTQSFAGAAPEILMSYIAAKTSRINIGSGGVMIGHYSPLKIAEQFQMLSALAPGRIDLGIGRAPGGDMRTSAALQAGPRAWPPEAFPEQAQMLRQFIEDAAGQKDAEGGFAGSHPYQGIRAQPVGTIMPRLWLLGSGGDSAIYAAQFGLPYVYAHFIGGNDGQHVIQLYKDHFKPSQYLDKPYLGFAVSAMVAETQEQADYLSGPRNLWATKLGTGQSGIFPSLETAAHHQYDETQTAALEAVKQRSLNGTAHKVADDLEQLSQDFDVDEFFIITITPDAKARQNAYRLLANEVTSRGKMRHTLASNHNLNQNKASA